MISSTLISYGLEQDESKMYTYKMDKYEDLSVDSVIKVKNAKSKEEKLQNIINIVEKRNFNSLEIKLVKIKEDIAYIDLRESENSDISW